MIVVVCDKVCSRVDLSPTDGTCRTVSKNLTSCLRHVAETSEVVYGASTASLLMVLMLSRAVHVARHDGLIWVWGGLLMRHGHVLMRHGHVFDIVAGWPLCRRKIFWCRKVSHLPIWNFTDLSPHLPIWACFGVLNHIRIWFKISVGDTCRRH